MFKKHKLGVRERGPRTPLTLNFSETSHHYKPCFSRVVTNSAYRNLLNVAPLFEKKLFDTRPYINIKLFDSEFVALLDSGASHSIIGKRGLWILNKYKLNIDKRCSKFISTADGKQQKINGCVDIPLCTKGTSKVINFFIVPSLEHEIILGSNFCNQFGIIMDFRNQNWDIHSGDSPIAVINEIQGSNKDSFQNIDISDTELKQKASIIESFKDIAGTEEKLGRTHKLVHHIETGNAKPFRQRQYLMSPYMLKHLNSELNKMLALNVVEPSHGAWNSPVLLVKKNSGEYRFCFDGRTLNSVTKPDRYPLPRVDRILNMLTDAKFISSIDLRSAFWQIPLDEESKEKTGFSVPGRGMFQFTVMPFGLSCSAQSLQRLMDAIFGPKLEPKVFCYLDDVIITSSTFEEHVKLLRTVRDRLKEANLTVNLSKCEFFKKSLKYLGFVIDGNGLRTDPEKVSAMLNYPRPRTVTEIKRFIGMCSWYRRFISHFSSLVSPLNDLLKGRKKNQTVEWTSKAEDAFINIKQALVSTPVLRSPDFTKTFTIQCDASDTGLGGVLTQEIDKEEVVIAFCSRSMSKAERNYCVTQRELLALIFCIEKFRPYIEGVRFKVISDHYSLLWLNNLKEPTGKLARWALKLQQYSFDLYHRKGKLNVVPDALSRIPHSELSAIDLETNTEDRWYNKLREKIVKTPENYPEWKVLDGQVYKHIPSKLSVKTNVTEWKSLVPSCQRKKVIASCHNPPTCAHLGFFKTLVRVQEKFYWPRMRPDILNYVRSCQVCSEQKLSNTAKFGLMGSEKKVSFPWQVIAVDIMGPLPRSSSGNNYLFVVADWFSKYSLLFPMRKAIASTIVKFMEERVFLVYGVPQFIICDNGTQFTGRVFKSLAKTYNVQKIWYNARYHPQTNFVERINKTVGTAIRSYIGDNHKSWDKNVYHIQYALNTAVHEVTGYSPAFVNFGRIIPNSGEFYGKMYSTRGIELLPGDRDTYVEEIKGMSEIYEIVRSKLHKAYQRNEKQYNLRRRDVDFSVGDKVWRRNKVLSDATNQFSAKLSPKYVLCVISEKISRLVYNLKFLDGSDAGRWHVKDLKIYLGSNSDVSVG